MPNKTSERMIKALQMYQNQPNISVTEICKVCNVTNSGLAHARAKAKISVRKYTAQLEQARVINLVNRNTIHPQVPSSSSTSFNTQNTTTTYKKSPKKAMKRQKLSDEEE